MNRMLSSLRSYLKYLLKIDYQVPLSPEVVELTRTEKKHPQVPELEELVGLIEAPTKLEKKEVISLCHFHGNDIKNLLIIKNWHFIKMKCLKMIIDTSLFN